MDRDMRIMDNDAIHLAAHFAKQHDTTYGAFYNLVADYLGGGLRQLEFKRQGLENTEQQAQEKQIPFFVMTEEVTKELPKFIGEHGVGMLITDFSPLRLNRSWRDEVASKIDIPFLEVDAHNVIPCWITSDKQEYAARTIRPKIHRNLKEFLTPYPNLMTQEKRWRGFPKTDWELIRSLEADSKVKPVDWAKGGEHEGRLMLSSFLRTRSEGYAEKRNDPNEDHLSNLSPYFHYGNLAPRRAALEVKAAHARGEMKKDDMEAFLEEAIVRRELSDNFCYYNENYDSCKGFPDWALKTLGEHANDEREHAYSKKQFEQAKTHDDLWNAAQMQMVKTGKMHGYMRMYWAKKILEWTNTITYAMEVAVYLNDKYELDGRDPNGYVGCAWSIGGVHDRAWTERPVYGKIRYMNANGARRKFDVDKYIKTWLE
jgi:deoxyribodipyrimidine photo-lyase